MAYGLGEQKRDKEALKKKSSGGRKIVSTAYNRNPFTGKPLSRSEMMSGGRKGVLRRAKGKPKLVGAKSTWVGRSGKIIAPKSGTREKAGQKIKNVRNRQKLMTKASNYLGAMKESVGSFFGKKKKK